MSAARSIRFRKKSPARWPWFLLLAVVLAALGWTGWRLVTDRPVLPGFSEAAGTAVPEAEASEGAPARQSAGEPAVRPLLETVMTAWVEALVGGDFTAFHASLSPSWRQKDDPAVIKAAYAVLEPHKASLSLFPTRGKLVLLESRPYPSGDAAPGPEPVAPPIRDTMGPESPWLVRGEWRVNKTALGFTLVFSNEDGVWRPLWLGVEIYPESRQPAS